MGNRSGRHASDRNSCCEVCFFYERNEEDESGFLVCKLFSKRKLQSLSQVCSLRWNHHPMILGFPFMLFRSWRWDSFVCSFVKYSSWEYWGVEPLNVLRALTAESLTCNKEFGNAACQVASLFSWLWPLHCLDEAPHGCNMKLRAQTKFQVSMSYEVCETLSREF